MYFVVIQIVDQFGRERYLVALREEAQRDLRLAVDEVHAQQRVSLRPADAFREFADQRFGQLLDGQQDVHLADHRVAQLLQLDHRDDFEFELLVVVGPGLNLSADEEEVVGEEVLAEVLIILAKEGESGKIN